MNVRASRFARGEGRRIGVSFEFFPPDSEEMDKILWELIERLAPLAPNFVSVTYGAGGSTRERTHATVKRILAETPLTPAAHLTCVAATREEIDAIVRNYHDAGVRHIVALRGDPIGRRRRAIRAASGRLSAMPPIWWPASSASTAISKSRCRPIRRSIPTRRRSTPTSTCSRPRSMPGATRAITQFFFENDLYFRYLDRVRARGIDIPIVPGILPVQNFKAATNFAARAGASVPAWLAERFHGLDHDAGDAQADRGGGRRRAGARPGRPRRHHLSFLHHEPRRPRLCDLPPAGLAAGGGASGLNLELR